MWGCQRLAFLRFLGLSLRHHFLDGLLSLSDCRFRGFDDALGNGFRLRFLSRFDPLPVTPGLPRTTDINRPGPVGPVRARRYLLRFAGVFHATSYPAENP